MLTRFLVTASASILGELDDAVTEKFILGLSDELVQRGDVANVKRSQDGAKLVVVLEVSAANSQLALDAGLERLSASAHAVPDLGLGWSPGAEWPNGIRTDRAFVAPVTEDLQAVQLVSGF